MKYGFDPGYYEASFENLLVVVQVENARAIDGIAFVYLAEQNVMLKPMVEELGCQLVSLCSILVGHSWHVRIVQPRIGARYTDRVI